MLRKRLAAAVAAAVSLSSIQAYATVSVQQIEAYEDTTSPKSHYAPINFNGSATVVGSGNYTGITFHALDVLNNTMSSHADSVATLIYGPAAPGSGYVTDVYSMGADAYFNNLVLAQNNVNAAGPIPGHFSAGVQVVNNSYVAADTSNLDDLRRMDFMINRDDVTFVASAANTGVLAGNFLSWSSFNSLAVRGDQNGFDPTNSPGKTHADIGLPGLPSFTTASVSGMAAGLYGHAQAAGQTAAQHGVVMRSLLMAGADKTNYTRQTVNNLDTLEGAGQADYNTSLAILSAGQQTLNTLSGSNINAAATSNLKGWSFATVAGGTQTAIVIHATNPIDGLTASLNWNVNVSSTATTINTTNAGVSFADLALELRPVTFTAGHYVLGASSPDATLHSNATGASNDNVEYLYSNSILPAGDYALLINGDPSLATPVGFSYSIIAPVVSQWALSTGGSWSTAANWSNGVPSGVTARANFLSGPGLTAPATVSLNGSRTVGQLTFSNANAYTIAPGTGGTLTIDDTGDGGGGGGPLITVNAGNHTISAPISLVAGLTVNTATSTSINASAGITGTGGLSKNGSGTLTLGGSNNFGDLNVNAGTLTLSSSASLASTNISVIGTGTFNANGSLNSQATINSGATVNIGANTGSGFLPRPLLAVNLGPSGTVTLATTASRPNRQVLIPGVLNLSGGTGGWQGKLDVTNNDMIVQGGSLSQVTNQIKSGFGAGSNWAGTGGITSSTAAADATHLTAVGVIKNDDGTGHVIYGSGTIYGTFDGQNPAVNDILVKYTWYGDADLNGKVDGGDYSKIDNGFNTHLGAAAGWTNGDFNYDGVVDGADYALIDNAFLGQTASPLAVIATATPSAMVASPLSSFGSASVPEPTTGSLIAVLSTALLARRRRSS